MADTKIHWKCLIGAIVIVLISCGESRHYLKATATLHLVDVANDTTVVEVLHIDGQDLRGFVTSHLDDRRLHYLPLNSTRGEHWVYFKSLKTYWLTNIKWQSK